MNQVSKIALQPPEHPESPEQVRFRRGLIAFLGVLACLLTVYLHFERILQPLIWDDDFAILDASWTWSRTCENFWKPANEHAMPLGRVTTWLLVCLAGPMTRIPLATGMQGVVGILAGMVLLYLFLRRETGRPFLGLLGMAVFGVTAVYIEAVMWFAASFQVLALDTTLLALLAAQRWRQSGRWPQLGLTVLWCCLAPMWFASGILAGPLCVLYLLSREDQPEQRPWRARAIALCPLFGSVLFLAITLPFTCSNIISQLRHDGRMARLQATGSGLKGSMPWIATEYTLRALIDGLVLGNAGVWGIRIEWPYVGLALVVLTGLAAWWWHRAARKRLLLVGLGFILLGYFLTFAGRSHLDYEFVAGWTRYHLFAQLGLALYLCGGLRSAGKGEEELNPLTGRQAIGLGFLVVVLFSVQCLHAFNAYPARLCGAYHLQQQEEFRRIEEMEERCRRYRISADTARAALGREPLSTQEANSAWDYLRGSDDPLPLTEEEARALLRP